MLRRVIKTGIARALQYSYTDKIIAACSGFGNVPMVVGYHRVVENYRTDSESSIPSMLISVRMLEHQLDWLGQRFNFITLDELSHRMEGGDSFDRPVAAVTFDDGYSDLYHFGFPLLKRKGIPATVFVVTDLVGTSRLQTHDELYLLLLGAFSSWRSPVQCLVRRLLDLGIPPAVLERIQNTSMNPFQVMRELLHGLSQDELRLIIIGLGTDLEISESDRKKLRSLDWKMLSEMHRAGVTIGSHTMTHPLLTNETWQRIRNETEGSRQTAEQKLKIPIRHFAYPDGRFNAATIRAVKAAGYRSAYTTCWHRDPHFPQLSIPRQLLWERSCLDTYERFSPAVMNGHVHRVFEFISGCRQDHR